MLNLNRYKKDEARGLRPLWARFHKSLCRITFHAVEVVPVLGLDDVEAGFVETLHQGYDLLVSHRFAFAYRGYETVSPLAGYESVQHNPLRYTRHLRFDSKRPNMVLIITDRPNQVPKNKAIEW